MEIGVDAEELRDYLRVSIAVARMDGNGVEGWGRNNGPAA